MTSQDESTNVSMVSVSRRAGPPHFVHLAFTNSGTRPKGDPPVKVMSTFSGRTKIVELQGHKLEASDFLELLNPDPTKTLLSWMDSPSGEHARMTGGEWKAFRSRCKSTYGFDPDGDGDLKAFLVANTR